MKNILIGVGVVAVIALIGYVISSSNNSSDVIMKKEIAEKESMMKEKMMMDETMKKDVMMPSDSMQKDVLMDDKKGTMAKPAEAMIETKAAATMEKDVMVKNDVIVMQKGSYVAYSEAAATQAVKTGKTILFFHASWCPTCRAADADILKNAANIPSGTTILKVDYDTSGAMKTKYGVTTQHTFVQVDGAMNTVTTWRGGNTLASIVASSK